MCHFDTLFLDNFKLPGLRFISMDGYVICSQLTSNTLELQGWWCDPGALPILEDYWTYTWIAIEELTTIFKIDMSQVSESDPVLPKEFASGSTFYSPPTTFRTTDKTYYLLYWEIGKAILPLDAIPGEEAYNFHILWHYSDEPPSPDNDYLLPYNQSEVDAGDGEKYLLSSQYSGDGIAYGMNLWRWQQWVDLNRYLCPHWAIRFHEDNGDPDWSEYVIEPGADPVYFSLKDEKVPPDVSNYLDGNFTAPPMTQEFVDAIDIDSGYLGDMFYYYVELGVTFNNWKPIVKGAPPEPGAPTGIFGLIVGLGWVLGASIAKSLSWQYGSYPKTQGKFTINRRKGVAANGVPQGHATELPDGIKS